MKKIELKLIEISKYFFYYSGLKYIWEKIHPRTREIPATFPLWVIGIYIALFGIASNRYENKVEKVENRISALVAQMSSSDLSVFRNAVANAPTIQRSKIPFRPSIFNPKSVFISFVSDADQNDESFKWLKQIIANHRSKLEGVNLTGIDLHGAWLPNGNFENSDLWDSDFTQSSIMYCNFKNTNLRVANFEKTFGMGPIFNNSKLKNTNFQHSYLPQAYFENVIADNSNISNSILVQANFKSSILNNVSFANSNLMGAFFKNVKFKNVSFENAILVGADFTGSNITIPDLKRAQCLYAAILPIKVIATLKNSNPELFIKPIIVFPDPFVKSILKKHSQHIFK